MAGGDYVAEPRRNPARGFARPPSDSLLRPTRRRLRPVDGDGAPSSEQQPAAAGRGWLIAVAFSIVVWVGLVVLALQLA